MNSNYKYNLNKISNNQIHCSFFNNNLIFTWQDFLTALKKNDNYFLQAFQQSLNEVTSKLQGFFWECPPVSQQTINQPFEFVATKSKALKRIEQNYASFQEHFAGKDKSKVCSFPSLGGDAMLITPIPSEKNPQLHKKSLDYKNLSEFTKNAPENQQLVFWQEVANKLEESLTDGQPKWLSTNGLGVHYLHARIDKIPKYYSHQEYKKFKNNPESPVPNQQNGNQHRNNQPQYQPKSTNSSYEGQPQSNQPTKNDQTKNPTNWTSLILIGFLVLALLILIIFVIRKISKKTKNF